MANAEKLRNVVKVIREHQGRWDQQTFCRGPVNTESLDYEDCGTTLCTAGWACLLDGLRPMTEAEAFLGDRHPVRASGLFYDPKDPNKTKLNPEPTAQQILGLNDNETGRLFYYFTDDVDELEARVEAIIAGDYAVRGF